MGALKIGRVGLDIDLDHPARWQESRGVDEREFVVSGFLRSTSVDNTKIIRSELLEQQGDLVAVSYTLDTHFDGFYILGSVRIETVVTSYLYRGLFPFEISLFRIGGESRTELQSNISGALLTNTNGTDSSEITPWISPSIGHSAFSWAVPGLTPLTRTTEDGTITVYLSDADFSEDATWGADPTTYYSGAAELWVGNPLRLRSGLDVPNDPGNWQITNGFMRFTAESGNTGRVNMEIYGGASWESLIDIAFDRGGKISSWDFFSVARNSPEMVVIRLVAGDGSISRDVLDIQLRRGSTFASCVWNYTGAAATLKVVSDAAIASSAITPINASSDAGVRATSNDGDGNRMFILTPQTHTNDLTNGGVSVATTNQIRFCLGYELNGSGATGQDTAEWSALQYFSAMGERVRAVWR